MFDWRDFQELARGLASAAPGSSVTIRVSESTDRCAVGRAYYAAFGHARAYAMQHLGFRSGGGASDHGQLIAHFRTHGRRGVARRLGQLRTWRNQCDYDVNVPNLRGKVRDALRHAATVISQL